MPAQANQPLPEGHQLQNYRILRVLASGGFSFVYLAHDENEAPVAIKEYLPSTLALRTGAGAVPVVPESHAAAFRYGMKCFFEEGRALATLAHPNVVRVLNFFRANETVYLVMRYERGRTLQEHIHARRGTLKETWIRNTFASLLNGLREVHSNKLLHLDIKPGNVYLRSDGTPLLIDFGAARQMLWGEAPALRVKTPDLFEPIRNLSGGNQQKVLVGRWLMTSPRILILDEPTRGIDVGAKADIHRLISNLATDGAAIVMISSEMPEILGMSDRVMVMREGRTTGILDRREANQVDLMRLAAH